MNIIEIARKQKVVTALLALVLIITLVSAIIPVLRPAVPIIVYNLVFIFLIFGVPYWASQKGMPLRWYELLGLVIGYLIGVFSTVILFNQLQELYILAGAMIALSLIIIIFDIRFILRHRQSSS